VEKEKKRGSMTGGRGCKHEKKGQIDWKGEELNTKRENIKNISWGR